MEVKAIKTRKFKVGESLVDFIIDYTKGLDLENTVLAVTSKIVSLAESRLESADIEKKVLVKRESDHFLGEIGFGVYLTIKEGLLIPSAGIDESNSEDGSYILYPEEPFVLAEKICNELKRRLSLKNFGLLFTDSHTLPLRRGVVGIALSYAGFEAVESLVGEEDLYGRKIEMTSINKADALSAASCLLMREAADSKPLALIKEADVKFVERVDPLEIKISVEDDLYSPIYSALIK